MRHNNFYYFLLLLIFFQSCDSSKRVVGKYCLPSDKITPDYTFVTFNANHTFTTESVSDVAGTFSGEGQWQVYKDILHVNQNQKSAIDTIIYKNDSSLSGKVRVRIFDIERKEFFNDINVSVNERSFNIPKQTNYVDIDFENSYRLIVELFVNSKIVVNLHENMNTQVDVFLNLNNLRTFKLDSTYKIKGGKLLPLQSAGMLFKKCE